MTNESPVYKPQDPRGLSTVWLGRLELLAKVRENKAAHRAVFEEAVAGYKYKVLELLDEHIERITNNAPESVYVHLPFPEDHSADYDRIISMLDMSYDDRLLLAQNEFAQYVMDDWHWKNDWSRTAAMYTESG